MSRKRLYQLTYKNTGEPIFLDELGNVIKISGLLLEGQGSQIVVLAPGADLPKSIGTEQEDLHQNFRFAQPNLEIWSEILRQTDDPVFFAQDETGIKKLHRKQSRSVSGAVQQKVWIRDHLLCLFCGRRMGEIQLTVDHFIPLELGGENDETNYISACRRCNKDKGSIDPKKYCESIGIHYQLLVDYLHGTAPHSAPYIAELSALYNTSFK